MTPEDMEPIIGAIRAAGFRVKTANRLYARGWGRVASPEERADTLHQLVRDDDVSAVFFGGGEGADDVLPYLDLGLIARCPKVWMSFSDGTSILTAVRFRAGLPVLYGVSPIDLTRQTDYLRQNLRAHVLGPAVREHIKSGPWHVLRRGVAQGELVGGYLDNFTYLANGGWAVPAEGKDYILALEEHEAFFGVDHVSDELARLENSPIMKQTRGILFGQYSDPANEDLLLRLRILADRHGIPLAYCDDFGHGKNKAILRFGETAELDTERSALTYL